MTENVFVYGTLRRGMGNHRLMFGAKYLGSGTVKGELHLHHSLPMLFKGDREVKGELYKLRDERQLSDLDALEGHPLWYKREVVDVTLEDGSVETGHVYFMRPEAGYEKNLIEENDYLLA